MSVDYEGIRLGFDPGGDCKFGVTVLEQGYVKSSTVGSVDDAMNWAVHACGTPSPVAAGIDTILHWATSKSGMRPCDLQLRNKYRPMQSSIITPNRLFGAMAIGGMALALGLREVWGYVKSGQNLC